MVQTVWVPVEYLRHPLHWHGAMFHAIANITQFAIMDNEPLFQVGYNESYNGHP